MSGEGEASEAKDEQTAESASKDTGVRGKSPAGGQREQHGKTEPAPTDLRRNIWILLLILGVVAAAWLVNYIVGKTKQKDIEPQTPPAPTRGLTQQPAESPPSYKEAVEMHRRSAQLAVYDVVAGKRRYLTASPPYRPMWTEEMLPPRLFDVTRTVKGFDLEDLVRPARMYADCVPLLDQAHDVQPQLP